MKEEEQSSRQGGRGNKTDWFHDIKIPYRIAGIMSLILLATVAVAVIVISSLKDIRVESELSRDESLMFAMRAKAFQVNVIQVQQGLMNISATRAAKGFNDGLDEAEANYREGLAHLDAFEELFREENEEEMTTLIENVRENFAGFYSMGKLMARAYIDFGPGQGNRLMRKFGPHAEKIHSSVDALVASRMDELNGLTGGIIARLKSVTTMTLVAIVILSGFIIIAAFSLSRSITSPANLLAKGIEEQQSQLSEVATAMEQTARQIQELRKHSEEFGDVTQVVDDIVNQATLLALNANIEAARAGETERGFAVVADEVRQLAERTVRATGGISQVVGSIGSDIRAAVSSMEVIGGPCREGA